MNKFPPNAERILDSGFIRLTDSVGDDNTVVKTARVSYGNETKGAEADRKLLKYLLANHHETPFEHLVFTFHVKCPIFVARQWFRHRIGSFNEISGRYVKLDTEFWIPTEWRINNQDNKQSSAQADYSLQETAHLSTIYHQAINECETAYEQLLDSGVAREQARGVLPLATYTEFYWTVNARSLFNFLRLRMDTAAQYEIQVYAKAILDLVQPIAPWTFEGFTDTNL